MITELIEKALGYRTIDIDGVDIKVDLPVGYIIEYQKKTSKAQDSKNIDKIIDIQYDLVKTALLTANPDITTEQLDRLITVYGNELLTEIINTFVTKDKKNKQKNKNLELKN